jgi:murein DD-endopeptidase MepM/ murein hydrolase activator NlpD
MIVTAHEGVFLCRARSGKKQNKDYRNGNAVANKVAMQFENRIYSQYVRNAKIFYFFIPSCFHSVITDLFFSTIRAEITIFEAALPIAFTFTYLMAEKKKPRKRLYKQLKNKYRLVIMNDGTLEEKASLRLSPLNVFVTAGIIILTLITSTIYIIAFTPLREYIPGYADVEMKRNLVSLTLKADSMALQMSQSALYFENLRNVIDGKVQADDPRLQETLVPVRFDTIRALPRSKEDSLLRLMVESQDRFELTTQSAKQSHGGISSFFFFTPVKGTVVSKFDPVDKHYGIDIVAPKNEPIKSTLDGTIIMSDWTYDTGYVLAIQHSNNLISIYKHNSALLKKPGAFVKAGEVVAIIGSSGKITTGPHLHFELWHNGSPVNPQDYMVF